MIEKLKKYKHWDFIVLGFIIGVASSQFDDMYSLLIFSISIGLVWGGGKAYLAKKKKNDATQSGEVN